MGTWMKRGLVVGLVFVIAFVCLVLGVVMSSVSASPSGPRSVATVRSSSTFIPTLMPTSTFTPVPDDVSWSDCADAMTNVMILNDQAVNDSQLFLDPKWNSSFRSQLAIVKYCGQALLRSNIGGCYSSDPIIGNELIASVDDYERFLRDANRSAKWQTQAVDHFNRAMDLMQKTVECTENMKRATKLPAVMVTATVRPTSKPTGSYPSGITAVCNDGTYSMSKRASGTCSGHGGVKKWINRP